MKNIQSMTRARAEQTVQTLNNGEELIQAMEHKNRHVGRAAFRRGMLLFWGASFFATLAEILPRVEAAPIPEEKSSQVEAYKALAEQYGESVGYVETIAQEKNGDLAAVKRSLISRKAARTVAAKKQRSVAA